MDRVNGRRSRFVTSIGHLFARFWLTVSSKCDGKDPCSTCRASKRRQKECVYSGKAKRANNRRSDSHATRTSRDVHGSNVSDPSDNPPDYTPQQSGPSTPNSTCEQVAQNVSDSIAFLRMCNPISVGQTVEEVIDFSSCFTTFGISNRF